MDKSMQKLVYQRLSAKISGKSFWFFWFAVPVMLASVFAAHAQSTSNISQTSSDAVDLQELTRQAVSYYDQRRQQAENYTYLKHGRFKRFDNRGKFHWESTTMEIVFIHGGQDVRMIEYNGRPIPREQQKSEWDRLQEIIDKHLEAAAKLHFQTDTYYYYYEYEPGTILGMEWTKINGEAWLPKSAHSKGKFRFLPARNSFPEEGEATYSDYKKFRVDTKVTPENSN
jgi:hypothetical protein